MEEIKNPTWVNKLLELKKQAEEAPLGVPQTAKYGGKKEKSNDN